MRYAIRPIGAIHTGRVAAAETPVQSTLNPTEHGSVRLDAEYREGLTQLDGFDAVWLLTWLGPTAPDGSSGRTSDLVEPPPVALAQVPFLRSGDLDAEPIGLFAMRGPRRPNPIGLHLVRLVALRDDGFDFAGVDMVDGTPLLDVKPWVARFDVPSGVDVSGLVRSGWFDTVDLSGPHTPSILRDTPDR